MVDTRRRANGGAPKADRAGRSFARMALELAPTANAVLLVVQAVLAQPPYDTALPPMVYVWVNAGVVLLAGAMRISAILLSNALITKWLRLETEAFKKAGNRE
jgi:hypothetical protein